MALATSSGVTSGKLNTSRVCTRGFFFNKLWTDVSEQGRLFQWVWLKYFANCTGGMKLNVSFVVLFIIFNLTSTDQSSVVLDMLLRFTKMHLQLIFTTYFSLNSYI